MLTKSDLNSIDKVVTKRIKGELVVFKGEMDTVVTKRIKGELVPINTELTKIKKDVGTIKSDIVQIRKDIKTIINYFDREYLELRKRVERLESHLNLPPLS